MKNKPLTEVNQMLRTAPYSRFADAYAAGSERNFSAEMAEFIMNTVVQDLAPVHLVVDLACGLGEACECFAARGFQVVGIDQSSEMLVHARASAQRKGLDIKYLEQDMRSIEIDEPADVVTCMYDSLNFMTTEADLCKVFERVRTSLRPGGCFTFDIYTIRGLAEYWGTQDEIHTEEPEHFVATRTSWNYESLCNTKTLWGFTYVNGQWERWREEHTVRAYPMSVVEDILASSGFRIARSLDWKDGSPCQITPSTIRAVIVAEAIGSHR